MNKQILKKLDDAKIEELVEIAEEEAKQLVKDQLKTSQIRNFYAAVSKMKIDYEKSKVDSDNKGKPEPLYDAIRMDLIMLKPKLAYAAGRQKSVKKFYYLMNDAIKGVQASTNKHKAIENFFALIESVVAYHKFHGGN